MQTIKQVQANLSQIRNGCLLSERGTGKSHGLALQILENLHLKSIVVTSQAFRATNLVRSLLEQLCVKHDIEYTIKCSPSNVSMTIGHCTISFVPVNSIVGQSCDLLLVDEFQLVPEEFRQVITAHDNWKAVATL